MTGCVTVGEALEVLSEALTRAGVPLWTPPGSSRAVDRLEGELAPLGLPGQVREFWRLVDVGTLRVKPYPRFTTPEFALASWRTAREAFSESQPLALLDVGYESHACLSVELEVDDFEGGALFEWFVSEPGGFARSWNGLTDWLRHVAAIVDRGWYLRRNGPDGAWLLVPDPEHSAAERAARPAPKRHPVHGSALHVGGDFLDWPAHWQRANRLPAEPRRPHGAVGD